MLKSSIPKSLLRINGKKAYCKLGHRRSPSNIDKQNHCIKCKKEGPQYTSLMSLKHQKQEWFRKLKDKPCFDCGNKYPSYAMDFDHRPREKKIFELRHHTSYKIEAILKEIEKCDLVCANCHRIRTFTRRGL